MGTSVIKKCSKVAQKVIFLQTLFLKVSPHQLHSPSQDPNEPIIECPTQPTNQHTSSYIQISFRQVDWLSLVFVKLLLPFANTMLFSGKWLSLLSLLLLFCFNKMSVE